MVQKFQQSDWLNRVQLKKIRRLINTNTTLIAHLERNLKSVFGRRKKDNTVKLRQ